MKEIQYLPIELQYKIFLYIDIDKLNIENVQRKWINYIEKKGTFDIDYIYFYIEIQLFFTDDNNLQVNIFCWFGTKSPEKYENGILHTMKDRKYPLLLERSFGNICKKINKHIHHLQLENIFLQDAIYAGTYGPLKKGILSELDIKFNKLSHANWSLSIKDTNLSSYFQKNNIKDLRHFQNIIISNLKNSIAEYNLETKNIMSKPIIKIKKMNYNNQNLRLKKIFYKLTKPMPSISKKIKKLFENKLIQ